MKFLSMIYFEKDIARFFLFRFRKIVSLAETNTIEEKRKLCSAYNEVLGIKKYEDLKKNLENLRLRFRRKSNDIENRNKLNSLLSKKRSLNKTIKAQARQAADFDSKLLLLKKEDEYLQVQLCVRATKQLSKNLIDRKHFWILHERKMPNINYN